MSKGLFQKIMPVRTLSNSRPVKYVARMIQINSLLMKIPFGKLNGMFTAWFLTVHTNDSPPDHLMKDKSLNCSRPEYSPYFQIFVR